VASFRRAAIARMSWRQASQRPSAPRRSRALSVGPYRLRADEADALHQWARVLARAGARDLAAEKLDRALEIYRRHGAGDAWLERARRVLSWRART
jgi:hypothetical protein